MALYDLKTLKPGQVLTEHGWWCLSGGEYAGLVHTENPEGMREHGWIPLVPATISIMIPDDFNPTAIALEVLDAEIERLKVNYHEAIRTLTGKRESLLALPNMAEPQPAVEGEDYVGI